jgi:hypothetical protein
MPRFALAQVVITEIMYDLQNGSDSGREWIEVFNGGTASITLSSWKLFENGTNHKITAAGGAGTLAPGAYAIVADNPANFKNDWPQFSGQLFDSAFSLSNAGETIILRDASSTDISSASYQASMGAAGDGNSLNRTSNDGGAFIVRRPSPGAAIAADAIPPSPPKPLPAPKVPKAKAVAKKSAAKSINSISQSDISADIAAASNDNVDIAPTEGAAAATPVLSSNNSYLWWSAAMALAVLAAGTLIAARYFGKKEWNIIEEKPE